MKARKAESGLTGLDVSTLARMIAEGAVKAEEATRAHLDRIEAGDAALGAWTHVDAGYAMQQAAVLDRHRQTGRALGPLHGVPVGIKDIIDVGGLPCENGTSIEAGRRPREDAFLVSRLREAGAVILGKTATTELAVMHPAGTRNPHDPERTPGGSSSGSAAAVAALMVPLAVGSQTNGSVIRPASYCGVVGYKPSRGVISRRGVLPQSPALDTMGVFARTIQDAAVIADVLASYDAADRAMIPGAPPRLAATAAARPPMRPSLAFVRSPVWSQADADVQDGFAELTGVLGDAVEPVDLPDPFTRAHDMHRAIMLADQAKSFARYYERGRDQISGTLAAMIEEGRNVLAMDYALAHDWIDILNAALDRLFDRFDAIITPAATGEAPVGLDSTGSPVFSTLWTYCGVPAITVPLLSGSNGMPIGVQVVGRRGDDARLLRTANWLVKAASEASDAGHNAAA